MTKQTIVYWLLVMAAILVVAGEATAQGIEPRAISCSTVTEIPQVECEALSALFSGTNGLGWRRNDHWLQTDTPCSWYGMSCEAGHVQRLSLFYNKLSGGIPSQLADLASLQVLNLGANDLSGSIPPELASLTRVQELDLGANQLSGSIPPRLGSLTNLRSLYLHANQLSGSIPIQLGSLVNLEELDLSINQLSGSIPAQLGNLANLSNLNLSANLLSGSIPPQLGNLDHLIYLDLGANELSSNIPAQLGSLTSLQELNLSVNQLSGGLPPELGDLANLETLYLSHNQLSGGLPLNLLNLPLYELHFDNTELCAPVDAAFQTWLNAIPELKGTGVQCTVGGYTISGQVKDGDGSPVPGVNVEIGTKSAGVDGNGVYALGGLQAASYTVTPGKDGYTFAPASRSVTVPPDASGQDFTAVPNLPLTFSIAGLVTDVEGQPVSGVTMTVGMTSTNTGGAGYYHIAGLTEGRYTVTPSKDSYTFDPPNSSVTVPPDAVDVTFTANGPELTIFLPVLKASTR